MLLNLLSVCLNWGEDMKTDIVIVGSGVGGLFCALNLPADKSVTIITKAKAEESDSFLAQGGICVLRNDGDYASFFEDTMRAGHYENNKTSVDIMIRSSRAVIDELIACGVDFQKDGGGLAYTREGAHSRARILYHEDETGREITSCLLKTARERTNIKILENRTMVDIIERNGECGGVIFKDETGALTPLKADYTVLATGGIGGLYAHSTNYPHLTGDGAAVAAKHNVALKNMDYIQIHPTTLYSEEKGRAFLISESVRGEGAVLLNIHGERFTDELQPRDVVSKAIFEQMEKDNSEFVYLSLKPIPKETILTHFPNIYNHCLEKGFDVTKEPIPVVPSQHYFMGGIDVDCHSKTTMNRLYAVGETSCNGVHGKNRLASNSLLESLVFAKRSAVHIAENYVKIEDFDENISESYEGCEEKYKQTVLDIIEKERKKNEQHNDGRKCRRAHFERT